MLKVKSLFRTLREIMDTRLAKGAKVMPHNLSVEPTEKYTISPEQHQFYADNGYLVIKGLIDFTTLYSIKQRFIQICIGVVDNGNILVVKEAGLIGTGVKGQDLINKLQDILHDDIFVEYFENPRLLHVVSQFVGPKGDGDKNGDGQEYGDNITAMHSMFINKPPGSIRHPPHQDLFYFPFRPAHRIVAAWTAVDDVTIHNGCLYVVPGSHRDGVLHAHGQLKDSNRLYHGILDEATVAPLEKRIHLEMSPGDTVFFHPLLVHGSGPNVSKEYRKAISCHFANSGCHYVDVQGTVQQLVADEVEAAARKKGFQISYKDTWQYKSKQVKGVRCSL